MAYVKDFTIEELLDRDSNFGRVMQEFADAVINTYKRNLEQSGRKATGNLLNSISPIVRVRGLDLELWLRLADYYYYVENGRKKGKFPPREPIRRWIEAKPVIPRPFADGTLPTKEQLTFLIQRKIAREGYEGSQDLHRAMQEIDAQYLPRLKEAFDRDLDRYLGYIYDSVNGLFNFL